MKLGLIIVNYNTPGITLDCLKSLKATRIPPGLTLHTILVDNASSDDSIDLIIQKFPEVNLVVSPKNLGFAGGNNLGIRAALDLKVTHILLLNNDTVVPKNFFTNLYQSKINDPDIGLLTPKIYFAKGYEFHRDRYRPSDLGKVIWSAGGVLDRANVYGSNAHVDEVDRGQFTSPQDTDFATGACLLAKAEVFRQIGLINEDYFLYLEDLEFSQRAKTAGWRIVFDPSVYLWHKVSQSAGIGSSLTEYFTTRNRLLFGMRYTPTRTRFALLRQAIGYLGGSRAQRLAVIDFLFHRLGKGSWLK